MQAKLIRKHKAQRIKQSTNTTHTHTAQNTYALNQEEREGQSSTPTERHTIFNGAASPSSCRELLPASDAGTSYYRGLVGYNETMSKGREKQREKRNIFLSVNGHLEI